MRSASSMTIVRKFGNLTVSPVDVDDAVDVVVVVDNRSSSRPDVAVIMVAICNC